MNTIGILGGGQLSRMLALAGIPLGLNFIFYEPKSSSCVSNLGKIIEAPYEDSVALQRFINLVDVVTYENENIPVKTLQFIKRYKTIHPNPRALTIMQDRLLEKNFFTEVNIPTTDFHAVNSKCDLIDLIGNCSLPVIMKKRTHGYDGKGQVIIRHHKQVKSLSESQCTNSILENFIPYQRELSIIACSDTAGHVKFYDISENYHKNGILVNARNISNDYMFDKAKKYMSRIMNSLNYVGVCTLELFEWNGQLIANELAPRVHNSGHWTIEGAVTSQFENHIRSIMGWPLGSTSSNGEYIMYNVLTKLPNIQQLLQFDGIHIHDYVKSPAKGRKVGHINMKKTSDKNLYLQIEAMLNANY